MAMGIDQGSVLDALPVMAWTALPDGNIDFINRRWSEYTGLSLDKGHGWGWQAAVAPEDVPQLLEKWRSILVSGEPGEMEARVRRFDGQFRRFVIRCSPMRDGAGRVVKWCGVGTDVEDLRHAEQNLRRRELDFQLIVDSIPIPVAVTTPTGEVEGLNQPTLDYFGRTSTELKGWDASDVVHPDDLERTIAAQREAHRQGSAYNVESRHRRADGIYRWHNVVGMPLRDQQGTILRWLHLLIDIDDRKRAEEALQQSEARLTVAERDLQLTIDSIPVFVASYRPDGTRDFVNRTWLDYMGVTRADATGPGAKTFSHFHPDDIERNELAWRASLASGEPLSIEVRVRRADGQYRWHASRRVPLHDEKGQVVRWYSVGIDIDDQKRAEQALRESERYSRLIVDSIPGMVAVFSPDGRLEAVNPQVLDYYGKTLEELKAWASGDIMHPEDIQIAVDAFARSIGSGEPFDIEVRARRSDGVYRWVQSRGLPLRDASGRIVRWYNLLMDIDERKRAQEALAANERQLRLIVDTIPGLVAVFGPDGQVEALNKQFLAYLGQTREEFENWPTNGTVHPDDLERHIATLQRSLGTGQPIDFETRLRGSDGSYRWFQIRGDALRDGAGVIVRWYCLMSDVDERKRSEVALLQSERHLAEAQRLTHTGSYAWSASTGRITYWSDELYRIWGFDPTDGLPAFDRFRDRIHPEDRAAAAAALETTIRDKVPNEIVFRAVLPDGATKFIRSVGRPVLDAAGQVVEVVGSNVDVTESHRAAEALRRKEAFLSQAQRLTQTGSLWWKVATSEISWSDESYRVLEYPSTVEPSVELIRNRVHPDDLALFEDTVALAASEGVNMDFEHRLLMPDGSIKHVHVVVQKVEDGSEEPEFVGAITDISARKQVEEELRRSEAFLADAQRLSRTGSFYWRVNSDELTWSAETYRIYELDPAVPVTFDVIRSRVHPDNLANLQEVMAKARSEGGDFDYETRLLMPDQSVKYLRVVAHSERDKDGVLELRGAVQDVTERRRADEALNKARSELAHVARVSSLGALTASIAHEVNQPLAGIITNASTCLRMLAADPPNVDGARETARRTIRDGNRAADVIARLRALFGKRSVAIEPVDLNEAVREVIALSWGDLQRSRVIVRTELNDELPPVGGDRVQLQQVIMNLLRNAADAMASVQDRPRQVLVKTELYEDGQVRLAVEDAGVGFGSEGAERLFQAFYTTKTDGMGIGLSISRSIVERHNGRLWAQANDGPGATFFFSIPEYTGDEAPEHEINVSLAPSTSNTQTAAGIS
jgi:PAS domain S-box-containing protein